MSSFLQIYTNKFVGRVFRTFLLVAVFGLIISGCGGGGGKDKDNSANGGDGTGSTGSGCAKVVFVKNDNDSPDGGDGSQQNPFNTLEANGYSDADVIYMMAGTGTVQNQSNGIRLFAGQKLLGDSISFSDNCNDIDAVRSFSATGPLPTITNSAGLAVDLSGNNEVAGIRIDKPLQGIELANASVGKSTTINIHQNVLTDASVLLIFLSGEVTINSNVISNGSIAIVDDGTTLDVTINDNELTGLNSGISISTSPNNQGATGQSATTVSGNTIENTQSMVAIEIKDRTGTHTVENNTISDTQGIGIEFENVIGTGTINNNVITNTLSESILVKTDTNQNLSLTIDSNTISDTNSIGLLLDNQSPAAISTVVSNNTINRSGDDGVEIRINNDGSNNYSLTGNQITDAGANGIAINMTGNFIFEDLMIQSNTISGSSLRGISFLPVGLGSSPVIISSIVLNTFTDNGEEGIGLFVNNNFDVRSHVTENSFVDNGGIAGLYARAAGANSQLCIVLAENESDTNYELEVIEDGNLAYEDLLTTNDGSVSIDASDGFVGEFEEGFCSNIQ